MNENEIFLSLRPDNGESIRESPRESESVDGEQQEQPAEKRRKDGKICISFWFVGTFFLTG